MTTTAKTYGVDQYALGQLVEEEVRNSHKDVAAESSSDEQMEEVTGFH